jgi:3-hydroxymyristoyl/3-hydroxydecanoyl-(acyl carrier protein) dehydratase
MDHHFRAFSFVDRIRSVQPGKCIVGSYSIPAAIESFSTSLVGEAVGQLAAWAAMAAVNFERRPVAGLAGSIELLAPVRPGQPLELAAELESVDEEAVAYGGEARVNGTPIIRLRDCVGPMVPIVDFDDPKALRDRFALLCGGGADPGAFQGLPALTLEQAESENGRCRRAWLQVPASADLFADHFPRRPVFPGSLLMHLNLQLAAELAQEIAPAAASNNWILRTLSDVKLRTFISPGERLECEARLQESNGEHAVIAVETRKAKKIIGGARVRLAAGVGS